MQLPLILVRFQQNSGEPSGPSKKWPRTTTDPVRAGITEKWAFLRSAQKRPNLAWDWHFCPLLAHLVPCWWVVGGRWWLWRAGCISQDTNLLYYYKFKYFMLEICFSLGNKKSLLPTLGVESQGGLWSSCTFHACSLVRCSHRLSIFFKPIFLPMLMLIVKISRILMSMLVINLILMQILTNNNCWCPLCFRKKIPCRICVRLEGKPARLWKV